MDSILGLIKQRLSLVEESKDNTFSSLRIYSETLPSLLVQCTGYIEHKVNLFCEKNKIYDKNRKIFQMGSVSKNYIDYFKKYCGVKISWNRVLQDTKKTDSFIETFKDEVSLLLKDSSDFLQAVAYIKAYNNKMELILQKLSDLKKYRDDFAHGRTNSPVLSIIAKQDFYIYFCVLYLIYFCIDDITKSYQTRK